MLPENNSFYNQDLYNNDGTNRTHPFFGDQRLNSIFKSNGYDINLKSIQEVLRNLEDWRSRENISTVRKCQDEEYCSGEISEIILSYNNIHGYISLLICIFGSLANALNVAVLTRRDLATGPINRLLTWLAVTDIFVMIEYVPFSVYNYLLLPGQDDRPYYWAVYMLFHMHFTQILHTASVLLTLTLAVWRYIAIKYPSHGTYLLTDHRCSVAIVSSLVLPPVLGVPSYFVFTIHRQFFYNNATDVLTKVYFVDSDYDGALYKINFWVHAVVVKLLPCVILTVISAWLIRLLYRANTRKKQLKGYSACPSDVTGNGHQNVFITKTTKRSKSERQTDRTTRMLVAVLLLFLLTEFPQGILGLLSGLLGPCFFKGCYNLFGEIMDALALINGAINFVLYCSMSRQFRTTFGHLFWNRCIATRRANSQTELQTTYV